MKIRIIVLAVAAVMAGWAPHGVAREAVALPGVVGAEGELNGVDTTGNATLTVGNNQNINTNNDAGGGFRTSANLTGSILFLGNSTVTGSTGAAGTSYLNLSAGVAGTTTNFNGTIFSSTLTVSGTGVVNFNGNVTGAPVFAADGFINLGAGRVLTGAVTTNTANTGTFTFNNGSSVTGAMGGANGLKQINVIGGNAAITGAVQAQGFSLGTNTLAITGALTTNAAGTIATTLGGDAVFGKITAGTANINAGGVTVIPTVTGVLTNGTTYKIVDAPAGTIGAPVSVVNNNPRYTFAGLPTTTGDVNIRLTSVAPLAALVVAPAAAAVAPILEVTAPVGSDLLAVQNAIAVLTNTAAIDNALVQLAPGTTNLAAPWVAAQATRHFEDLWMARMDEIQRLCCDTCAPNQPARPINTHECKDIERTSNWWMKAFGNEGRQDNVNNITGYRTEAQGIMLAYDKPLNANTRVGLGGGYANTAIDGNNSSGRTTIDSYQVTAYISHVPGPWFVTGAITTGVDRYKGTRNIVFPGVDRTASATYTGGQYTGVVTTGVHYRFNDMTVTPLASLQASRIRVGSYSERGAGDSNLRVDSQDYDFLQSSLGVKAEWVMRSGNGTYSPEVHAKWLHDFSSTTMQQDAAFVGGGARFATRGVDHDRDLYNVGVGISFLSCNCGTNPWTVKGLYDYKWNNSNYESHQLSLLGSLKF